MTSSLSNLVHNLAEVIHKTRFRYRHDYKKCEICGIRYKNGELCLEYTSLIYDLIQHKCLFYKKN